MSGSQLTSDLPIGSFVDQTTLLPTSAVINANGELRCSVVNGGDGGGEATEAEQKNIIRSLTMDGLDTVIDPSTNGLGVRINDLSIASTVYGAAEAVKPLNVLMYSRDNGGDLHPVESVGDRLLVDNLDFTPRGPVSTASPASAMPPIQACGNFDDSWMRQMKVDDNGSVFNVNTTRSDITDKNTQVISKGNNKGCGMFDTALGRYKSGLLITDTYRNDNDIHLTVTDDSALIVHDMPNIWNNSFSNMGTAQNAVVVPSLGSFANRDGGGLLRCPPYALVTNNNQAQYGSNMAAALNKAEGYVSFTLTNALVEGTVIVQLISSMSVNGSNGNILSLPAHRANRSRVYLNNGVENYEYNFKVSLNSSSGVLFNYTTLNIENHCGVDLDVRYLLIVGQGSHQADSIDYI
tara:strand:- start:929 stop:2149 length:1221 start_codon:yes stop_codon:yes gene_type:complete